MPTPYGDITTTQTWLTPTEEITEKFPPEEVDEFIIEVDTEEEMQENVELFDAAIAEEQNDL